MKSLSTFLPSDCELDAQEYFAFLGRHWNNTEPDIKMLWAELDRVWDCYELDENSPDPVKLSKFYAHPVWLLNGIFTEEDQTSFSHRQHISDWLKRKNIQRIADFGGGYGSLGRIIAHEQKLARIDIIEPHPRPEALRKSENYPNLRYSDELAGPYDAIISTDVFEHVEDPLGLLIQISKHLDLGGYFIVANHFAPSIKCHLPCTFHFSATWPAFMELLGYQFIERLFHGEVYRKATNHFSHAQLRKAEKLSIRSHPLHGRFPGSGRFRRHIIKFICKFS